MIISSPRLPARQTQSGCNDFILNSSGMTSNRQLVYNESECLEGNAEEDELSLTLESLMREEMCAIC